MVFVRIVWFGVWRVDFDGGLWGIEGGGLGDRGLL
jgi:hypothetical protein